MQININRTTAVLLGALVCSSIFAFRQKDDAPKKTRFMQVTTIESIIPGGMGRSRMVVTDETGNKIDSDLENFYSLVGINFGNIAGNDKAILAKLNSLSAEGWALVNTSSGTQSPSQGYGQGIFLTRYLLKKQE